MEPHAFHPRGASQLAEKTTDSHGETDSDGLCELVRRRCAICLVVALLSLLVSVQVQVFEGLQGRCWWRFSSNGK